LSRPPRWTIKATTDFAVTEGEEQFVAWSMLEKRPKSRSSGRARAVLGEDDPEIDSITFVMNDNTIV